MSILGNSETVACKGVCSHAVGDDVCRGCGRTVEQVRDWNSYSREQKIDIIKAHKENLNSAPESRPRRRP